MSMKTRVAGLGLGLSLAGALLAATPAAHADPTFPCGTSKADAGGSKLYIHYHNCGSRTVHKVPFNTLYGNYDGSPCKTIRAGATVGWLVSKTPHPELWTTRDC
jgi:hypothetical protein